jgi:hypothetical protein
MATGPDANDLIDGELRRYSFRTVCDEITNRSMMPPSHMG